MNGITKISLIFFFVISWGFVKSQNIIKDLSYISVTDTDSYKNKICKLDLSYFKNEKGLPVVIFFHGGGLTSSTDSKYFPQTYSSRLRYIEVAPNYRLSPSAKCPAYLEDAAESIAWVWNNIEKYGGDKKKIIVTGNSAGAYLAIMMAMDTTYLQKYSISSDSIWIYFTESAQMTTHFTILSERGLTVGSDYPLIDNYAPLYFKRCVKSHVVLSTGDRTLDMAGRYEQNIRMFNMLDSLGVKVKYWEFPGETHTSVGPVARSAFISELYNGVYDSIINKFSDESDQLFVPNVGELYNIIGQKIKDNPTSQDVKTGIFYIYKQDSKHRSVVFLK